MRITDQSLAKQFVKFFLLFQRSTRKLHGFKNARDVAGKWRRAKRSSEFGSTEQDLNGK